jgi:hypothetical protein
MILGGPGVLAVALGPRRPAPRPLDDLAGPPRPPAGFCQSTPRHAKPRHAMPSHGTGRDGTGRHRHATAKPRDATRRDAATLRDVAPRHATDTPATTRHDMLCCATPRQATPPTTHWQVIIAGQPASRAVPARKNNVAAPAEPEGSGRGLSSESESTNMRDSLAPLATRRRSPTDPPGSAP